MEKDEIQLVDIDRQMREAYLDYAMNQTKLLILHLRLKMQ